LGQAEDSPGEGSRFTGRITGNDVHIRSGAGTNFYRCGKLKQGDMVDVVAQVNGWSKIVPPPGSFSWIAMRYVALKMDDPEVAVVTGNNVAVYAGSDFVEPMHSTSKQTTLPRGTRVNLFDEQKDGYFKIVPPTGSYLWVSSLYIERVKEEPIRSVTPLTVVTTVPETNEPAVTEPKPEVEAAAVETVPEPEESEQLKAFYVLQEKTAAELSKPLEEQDYTPIKQGLQVLVESKEDEDAVRYAAHLLKRIETYELAQSVGKAVDQQDQDLSAVRERLAKARAEELAKIKRMGKFAVMGKFRASSIYRAQVKRFMILDTKGKIMCYAEPAPAIMDRDFKDFVGKRVGLVGKIKPFPAVNGSLVVFTDIVDMDTTTELPPAPATPSTPPTPPTVEPPKS
jgi:uncharacterized protein YgiM (DUF1202 family)